MQAGTWKCWTFAGPTRAGDRVRIWSASEPKSLLYSCTVHILCT